MSARSQEWQRWSTPGDDIPFEACTETRTVSFRRFLCCHCKGHFDVNEGERYPKRCPLCRRFRWWTPRLVPTIRPLKLRPRRTIHVDSPKVQGLINRLVAQRLKEERSLLEARLQKTTLGTLLKKVGRVG